MIRILKNIISNKKKRLIKRKLGLISDNLPKLFWELEFFPRFTPTSTQLLEKEIQLPDSSSFLFMFTEIFLKNVYQFKSDKKSPRIIDCGANIGLSLIYFQQLFPDAEFIAFEPDKTIFKYLQNNTSAFNFNKLNLINKGLWNKESTLAFHSEGADGGAILEGIATNVESNITIETCRLSDYLDKQVDFLKMDIEGAEGIVLEDSKEQLKNVKNIFVEYHSFIGNPQNLGMVINILTDAGFRLHINAPGLRSSSPFVKLDTYNGMDMQLNIYGFRS